MLVHPLKRARLRLLCRFFSGGAVPFLSSTSSRSFFVSTLRQSMGWTAMHFAARAGNVDCLDILIRAGGSVDELAVRGEEGGRAGG